jgi:hypothetical protein
VIVARWTAPLPSGVTFGSFFGLADDTAELHNDDWTGWKVYVSSDQSQYARSPLDSSRYPCNTWLDLAPGAADYSFAVSDRGGLAVTLCSPTALPTVCNDYTIDNPGSTMALQWHAVPTTVKVISPEGGMAGLYFWRFSDESTYATENLVGVNDEAEYLDQGHIVIQNGNTSGPLVLRVCSPAPGAVPYLS